MKKQFFIAASLCLALTACDHYQGASKKDNKGNPTGTARDRNQAMEQQETEADRAITQRVRQAIMEDESLGNTARTLVIVTSNGVVLIRGPVRNEREKSLIAQKVRSISGVRNIDNQLEVAHGDTNR